MTEHDPWRTATAVGCRMCGPGTKDVSRAEMDEAVAGLREAAARVPALVASVSQLPATRDDMTLVVDRTGIVRANASTMQRMLGIAAAATPQLDVSEVTPPGPAVGAMLAVLAGRILGQFDPFAEQPRLLLVAPNIVGMQRKLGVDAADFRCWVCLHEQTHRAQFAAAPWLTGHLTSLITDLVAAEAGNGPLWTELGDRMQRLRSARRDDPDTTSVGMLAAVAGPRAAAALDSVMAAMSLLEGYADVMMDAVGPQVIPTVAAIREAFEEHRARGGLAALIGRLLGLDAKMAQYAEGARFCRAVLDGPGLATLNLAWDGADNLPTLDEVRAPQRWIDRMQDWGVGG
ncbi:MAG: zinc-dependent metalloprotease [Propionibacteriaceae bacterium]|nr:zinc-dependent metalloprotease [Propionibacteriaceae bacterium]